MMILQPVPHAAPFLPVPGMTEVTNSTTVPVSTVPVSSAVAASTEQSSGNTADHKASNGELPLWVETKTTEGKVSRIRHHCMISK